MTERDEAPNSKPRALDRREFLQGAALGVVAATTAPAFAQPGPAAAKGPKPFIIATEEAFATTEYLDAYVKELLKSTSDGARHAAAAIGSPQNRKRLTEVDARLEDMDANGVDMHLLSLTSPGVQIFDADYATGLARRVNDTMAAFIRTHPARFAGLGAVAPQDPKAAAAEVGRAMNELGMKGLIINSHTQGHFLDEPQFEPLLAAAERHKAPIYLHPQYPPPDLMKVMDVYGMSGPNWGFAAECGFHAMRLVFSGVFDRHPDLKIVLGHMGEALPFFFYRFDNVYRAQMATKVPLQGAVKLDRKPSDYLKTNFYITTSGMFWDELLDFGLKTMGPDHILFAIDYPYENSRTGVDFMLSTPIGEVNRRKIAWENTARLFNITGIKG